MRKLTLQVSEELDDTIDAIARESGTSKEDVIRRSLAVMIAFRHQKTLGRMHIGFVSDPNNLDVELMNVLTDQVRR